MTLALAYDIDALADTRRPHPGGLAEAPAEQQRALHLDDRVPGAQGQPEGHQGLGRSRQARRRRDHAEPEDLGRRALELSRRVGLCREAQARQRRGREGLRREALQERAGARLRRARLDDDVRRARHRRRAARVGERGATSRSSEARRRQVRDRRAVASASSPSRRSPSSTRSSTSTARARSPRRISSYLYSPEGQEIAAQNYYRPRDADGRGQVRDQVRRSCSCSRSTRRSAAGSKAQTTHFADGGIFDQIYAPDR